MAPEFTAVRDPERLTAAFTLAAVELQRVCWVCAAGCVRACVRARVGSVAFDVSSLKTFHLFLSLLGVCERAWELLGEVGTLRRVRRWRTGQRARTRARARAC